MFSLVPKVSLMGGKIEGGATLRSGKKTRSPKKKSSASSSGGKKRRGPGRPRKVGRPRLSASKVSAQQALKQAIRADRSAERTYLKFPSASRKGTTKHGKSPKVKAWFARVRSVARKNPKLTWQEAMKKASRSR
jgi:hypothetical protein